MEGRNIQQHPPASPGSGDACACMVWEPTGPFAPLPTSVRPLIRNSTTWATASLCPPSLSKHDSWQTPSLTLILVGSFMQAAPASALLPSLPAPQPGHLQACSGTNCLAWFGASCSPLPPQHIFFPFTAAVKEEALFVPNSSVHFPKPRRRQWGHLPLSCL